MSLELCFSQEYLAAQGLEMPVLILAFEYNHCHLPHFYGLVSYVIIISNINEGAIPVLELKID